MKKLLILFCRRAWLVLLGLLVISLLAATQLNKVRIELSADDLLVQNDPEREYYQEVSKTFSEEEVLLLYLGDEDLVTPVKLAQLVETINQLETLEFVERTESLFSVPHLKTVEGYLNKDPYFLAEKLPQDAQAAQHILEMAVTNPFVKRNLLSEKQDVMAIAIVLQSNLEDFNDQDIVGGINRVSEPLKSFYSTVFTVGYQHIRTEVATKIKQEQGDLFPLAVLALLICLFILLRQLVDILIPVMTASISILWTLGMMGFFDIPLNVVTSIIPILLIIVGSTEDIHLLSEFRRGQINGLEKLDAIEKMAVKMGGIILLTFFTTYIGFFSITLSKIEVLSQFALLSATGLLFNFMITISLIPAILKLTGDWKLDGKSRFFKTPDVGHSRPRKYYSFIDKYRVFITASLVSIAVVAVYGISYIKVNHNPIDNLNDDSPVKGYFESVNDKLSGLESMSVVIESGIQDTFLKSRYIEELQKLQNFINEQPGIRSSTSFADYLSLLNGAFQELPYSILPESDEIVNELMLFLEYDRVSSYVTEDYSRARILVRHRLSSTEEIRTVVNKVQAYIDNNLDKGLNARLTGDSMLTLSATEAMITGQLKSILVLLLSIVLIISLLFMDWKVGLIAAVPNVFPVIVLFGVMGFFEIPLNIGTTMAAAIAIGLAVDNTMHFMLRYNNELKIKRSQMAAMYSTLENEALPVFATSLSLIGGFMVFIFSDFGPVQQFGYLSAIVMLTALIADFVITPLIISALRLITLWDMFSLDLRKEVIAKSLLFKNMRPWQIRKFFLYSRVQNFQAGDSIFGLDDSSDSIYLVLRGEVEIQHFNEARDLVFQELIPLGEVFGDIAMLTESQRTSEAVALKQTSLLLVTREGIMNATNYNPIIGARLFSNLATHVSLRFSKLINELSKKN